MLCRSPRFLAIFVSLAIALAPQLGRAQSCTPLETVLKQVDARGFTVEQFTGADLTRAVEFFNRIPPETDEAFTLAFVIALPDGSGVLMVGKDGAVCSQVRLPADKLRMMTTRIRGISI